MREPGKGLLLPRRKLLSSACAGIIIPSGVFGPRNMVSNIGSSRDFSFAAGPLPGPLIFGRASGVWSWNGSQLVASSTDVPAFDVAGGPLGGYGLLLEPQSTNLVIYSSVDNTHWTGPNCVITTGTPSTIADNATSGTHTVYTVDGISYTAGQTYAVSMFFVKGTATVVQLVGNLAAWGTTFWGNFDLTTGAVGSLGTGVTAAYTVPVPGGYRCTLVGSPTGTAVGAFNVALVNNNISSGRLPAYVGSGQSLSLWGAQSENLDYTSSFLPTAGATITRAATTLSLPLTAVPWLQSPSGFSVILNFDCLEATNGTDTALFGVSPTGDYSNSTLLYTGVAGMVNLIKIVAGTSAATSNVLLKGAGQPNKVGFTLTPAGAILAVNGVSYTLTNAGYPVFNSLVVGSRPWAPGTGSFPIHARRLSLFGAPLSSAALVGLTT